MSQFSVVSTIYGYDVIDERGHEVAQRVTWRSANGVAYRLNRASKGGAQALVSALEKGRQGRVGFDPFRDDQTTG